MFRILMLVLVALTFQKKVQANDSCEVFLNKKLLFKGPVDQQEAAASVKGKKVKKADVFVIKYYCETANKGWSRTFYIADANDQNIKTVFINKQSGIVAVNGSAVEKSIERKQPVFIYTTSIPNDKTMAARIRVRRVFICKIQWN